jgi:hypothetical protein
LSTVAVANPEGLVTADLKARVIALEDVLWFDAGQPLVTSTPTAVNPLLTRGIQNEVHIRATLHVASLTRILAAGPLLFNLC